MTIRILIAAVAIAGLLANPVWAQTSTTIAGSFDSLSPGNQKIANALFSAQKTTGTTLTPLTRDQIAGLKSTEGWGRVFKTMKADGLIQARNLGQVVSQHEHALHASTTSTAGRATTTRTATIRRGHATHFAAARLHGSAGFAGGRRFTAGPHAMGGGFGSSGMGGGFGHAGIGGGFGGGFAGGGHGGGGGHGR